MNIKYESIDLSKAGINNLAFDLPYAIVYMCEAVSKGKKILGGDIVVFKNGMWTEGDDNWYSDKISPVDTLTDAIAYLTLYCKNSKKHFSDWKVSVVLSD